MLEGQAVLPKVYLNTFLTNNPVSIKVRCLEEYLKYIQRKKDQTSSGIWLKRDLMIFRGNGKKCRNQEKYVLQRMEDIFSRWGSYSYHTVAASALHYLCEEEKWDYGSTRKLWSSIKAKWNGNLQFYYFLSAIGANIDRLRAASYLCERDKAIKIAKKLAEAVGQCCGVRDHVTRDLIADYFWQRMRWVTEEEFFEKYNEVRCYYEEEFLTNQAVTCVVEDYVESDAYNKVKKELREAKLKDLKGIYDFYTDYELFSAMAQRVEKKGGVELGN